MLNNSVKSSFVPDSNFNPIPQTPAASAPPILNSVPNNSACHATVLPFPPTSSSQNFRVQSIPVKPIRPQHPRRAPFMQVLEEMCQHPMTVDQRIIANNYPQLMQCYEEDLKRVYTAAEESVCRIIAHTKLPDLSDAPTDATHNEDPLPDAVKNAFFNALNEMQAQGIPSVQRGALPKHAVAKFKQWFDINAEYPYPSDEVKVALSNETGIAIAQISNWFTNHRKRVWKPSQPEDDSELTWPTPM